MRTRMRQSAELAWRYGIVNVAWLQSLRNPPRVFGHLLVKHRPHLPCKFLPDQPPVRPMPSTCLRERGRLSTATGDTLLRVPLLRPHRQQGARATIDKDTALRSFVAFEGEQALQAGLATRKSAGSALGHARFIAPEGEEEGGAPRIDRKRGARPGCRLCVMLHEQIGRDKHKRTGHEVARLPTKTPDNHQAFLHKPSAPLACKSQRVAVWDLNPVIQQNHCLAKPMADVGRRASARQPGYKAAWDDLTFVEVNGGSPSRHLWSHCRSLDRQKVLLVRAWIGSERHTTRLPDIKTAIHINTGG